VIDDDGFGDDIEVCFEAGWTDGLPVVPPTTERVAAMLGSELVRADECVSRLPPSGGEATLRRIAANAVMAGCRPEMFPVVVAAVRAIADPAFQLERVLTSLHSRSPMVVVHGPVADAVGMNGGASALGAGTRANAAIGRAVLLICRNVAGARQGGLNPATLGQPGSYSFCFSESPLSPWPPLHTTSGFEAADSAVTVYAADAPVCIAEIARLEADVILGMLASALSIPGTYNSLHRQDLWLVLSPTHADVLASAGLSRGDVARFLATWAAVPAHLLPVERMTGGGLFEGTGGLDADRSSFPVVDDPGRVRLAVAGSAVGGYSAVVFGSGVSVTRRVDGEW
jgi:hypothetical protein